MELRDQLKRLSKDTIVFGLGAAVQRFIGFLLFPIYARLLSKDDFGTQDLVLTVVVVVSVLLLLGMESGALLHYYESPDNEREKIRSTFLWSQVFLSVPVCALLIVFAAPICVLLFDRPQMASYLQLGVASVPFLQIARALSLILRLEFRTWTFVVWATASVIFQVLAAVVLVAMLRWGVTGVFVAGLIAGIFQVLLGFALARGVFRLRFSGSSLARMLKVGLPLVPSALSVWVLNSANRYVLARYATLADIGVLSVAIRISSILLVAISAFEASWGPFAYSVAKNQDVARQTYAKVLIYFLALVVPAAAALSIFAREITSVLATPEYASGAALVPLYCFNSVFWVLLNIVGMGAGIAKKTYHNTIATVVAAGVNILLNLVLIPSHGILGAALATIAATLVALVYMSDAGQHYLRVPYHAGKVFALGGLAVVAIVPAVVTDQMVVPWHPAVLWVKLGLVLVPVLGLFALRVVSPIAVLEAARGIRKVAWGP